MHKLGANFQLRSAGLPAIEKRDGEPYPQELKSRLGCLISLCIAYRFLFQM